MKKRFCHPKEKFGTLRAYWGREDRFSGEDLQYQWGPGCDSGDCYLIHEYFGASYGLREIPLIKKLEEAGYDIKTLKFSIEKKKL